MGKSPADRPQPSPFLEGICSYRVAKAGAPVDLRLDANEGAPPPASLLKALEAHSTDVVRRYPDARALETRLAKRLGVEVERVLVTAGGDEAINRLSRAVLAPGRVMINAVPTFVMLDHFARLAGGTVIEVPCDGPAYPTDAVIARITPKTALIAVVSPNNPTGAVIEAGALERLSRAAPHAVILLDLAYTEFADEDLTGAALRLPNVVVVRTFSKAYGLAGLRVGYAAGPAEIVDWMRTAGGPYGVARPSLAIAEARLRDAQEEEVDACIRQVKAERTRLEGLLRELGIDVAPSQGNFVFARFGDALWVRDALAGLGIAVRAFPGAPYLEDAVRVTCPASEPDFERLHEAVRTALAPEAILFDMDGVLADVSQSYRQTILATAESYGVTVTTDEVTEAKLRGQSNNDWILTHRLLGERGVETTLEEVTLRFEALYQGTDAEPGLRIRERLMIEPERLEALSRKVTLAVVTGRPRSDAARFLDEKGVGRHFSTVVCMEDAPPKPSPAPVKLALERLGLRNAWMVGDTADDIRAARGASVVPIGVAAPGDAFERTEERLTAAGAARVLRQVHELEGLLP